MSTKPEIITLSFSDLMNNSNSYVGKTFKSYLNCNPSSETITLEECKENENVLIFRIDEDTKTTITATQASSFELISD